MRPFRRQRSPTPFLPRCMSSQVTPSPIRRVAAKAVCHSWATGGGLAAASQVPRQRFAGPAPVALFDERDASTAACIRAEGARQPDHRNPLRPVVVPVPTSPTPQALPPRTLSRFRRLSQGRILGREQLRVEPLIPKVQGPYLIGLECLQAARPQIKRTVGTSAAINSARSSSAGAFTSCTVREAGIAGVQLGDITQPVGCSLSASLPRVALAKWAHGGSIHQWQRPEPVLARGTE